MNVIFLGPPGAGVYSPSVQYTLFQMGRLLLVRCGGRPAHAPPRACSRSMFGYMLRQDLSC